MATISFKLDDSAKAEFDHLVSRNGLNASEVIRQALDAKMDELRQRSVGISLTKKERLFLHNQFTILAALAQNDYERKDYEQKCTAISSGYEREYDDLFVSLDDEVPRVVCQEVLDILDLHRAMTNFVTKHSSDAHQPSDFQFVGFDGNEETSYWSYCRYFIEELGRYPELANDGNRGFNSHWPTLPTYRSMLEYWKQLPRKWDLTPRDIDALIAIKS